MSILKRLTKWFSRQGRDDNRLRVAMGLAHAKRPAEAIAVYDSLVNAKGASCDVRARALFNRALAYSSSKDDRKAIADLEEIITLPGVPENVLTATREQLVRVRNRVQRVKERSKA